MKLNDTTKTVGSIIAVMLIPIAVIGWNYFSGQTTNDQDNDKLNVADITETGNNIDLNIENEQDSTVTEKPKTDPDENTKPGSAIGGVKTLPNTSKNPTPDE